MALGAELQVLSIYKKYLTWDTKWSHGYDKADNKTEEVESQSRALKEAKVLA